MKAESETRLRYEDYLEMAMVEGELATAANFAAAAGPTAGSGTQGMFSAIEEREAAIARKEAEKALYDRHPDFEDIRGDDKFHSWAETQPEQIQEWIYNNPNNVNLAIKAIDLYKLENNISNPKKQKSAKSQSSKSAADFVSTKTKNVDTKEPKIWTQREIARMSMRDFDKYEEEIDQAIIEGRVR